MKKALLYALTLALALSLTACGQPKAEQPTDPTPSTSVPEPIKDTTLGPEPEQTPAAPVETEDTQTPEETDPQEEPKQTEPTEPVSPPPAQQEPVEQQTQPSGGGQQQTPTDTQSPTPGYNPWENDDSNVVIDTRTEEQKQQDIKDHEEIVSGVTGTIQAGGLGTQKIDGHDDLGDYVLNGTGGKYYPALGITLPVSYDGKTDQQKEDPNWTAVNPEHNIGETQTAEQHTEAWQGVTGGQSIN
jgi:hypothetical protein